ncbi:hypothetical protein R3P38DRAFT_2806445 [Favolaschia claudopus]|uniref:Uncharacterized protein n=1 Tax=Favolaschia claudopus TaxID=2862362 RepID=A0AAV9ZK78_9AGAR
MDSTGISSQEERKQSSSSLAASASAVDGASAKLACDMPEFKDVCAFFKPLDMRRFGPSWRVRCQFTVGAFRNFAIGISLGVMLMLRLSAFLRCFFEEAASGDLGLLEGMVVKLLDRRYPYLGNPCLLDGGICDRSWPSEQVVGGFEVLDVSRVFHQPHCKDKKQNREKDSKTANSGPAKIESVGSPHLT